MQTGDKWAADDRSLKLGHIRSVPGTEPINKIMRIAHHGMRGYIKLERGGTGNAAEDRAAQAGAQGDRRVEAARSRPRQRQHDDSPAGSLPDKRGGETAGDRLVASRPPVHGR